MTAKKSKPAKPRQTPAEFYAAKRANAGGEKPIDPKRIAPAQSSKPKK
jgi:hypothetical protein